MSNLWFGIVWYGLVRFGMPWYGLGGECMMTREGLIQKKSVIFHTFGPALSNMLEPY